MLNSSGSSVVIPVPADIPAVQHYTGTVKTKYGKGVGLYKNALKTVKVCAVPEGATVEVTSDCISGTMAPAKYGVYNGYVDTQYLVNRVNIK